MAKRSVLILIIALVSVYALVSCNETEHNDSNKKSENGELVCVLWIYPVGTLSESYQISLFENHIMQVNMGEREETNNLEFLTLKKIDNEISVELSDKDYSSIMTIVDRIYLNEEIKTDSTICKDGWSINFLYKDKNIIQPCYEYTSPELEELYKLLIKLSPIEIDMRGFA